MLSLLLAMAGCSGPTTTELNRQIALDPAARTLVVKTTLIQSSGNFMEAQASATFTENGKAGFETGVIVTCNGETVVDTKNASTDTNVFIEAASGEYDWSYTDPDTSFEILISAHPQPQIVRPLQDSILFRRSTFGIQYVPTEPSSNLRVLQFDPSESRVTFLPTSFDPNSGIISSVQPDSSFSIGFGFIALGKLNVETFSNSDIRNILVEDSTTSNVVRIEWR